MAWHVRNVLEQYDIATRIKNDKLYSVAGELPINECLAEVWVVNKLDYRRAVQIIQKLEQQEQGNEAQWRCRQCGEENAANFAICWSCQASIASQEDAEIQD